jgi:hypothetical protein
VTDGVVEALEAEGDPNVVLDSLARRLAAATPKAACVAVMERVLRAGPPRLAPPDDRTVVAFVPQAPWPPTITREPPDASFARSTSGQP